MIVNRYYLCHDEISLLHGFSHVELIFLILFSLLREIRVVETQVSKCCSVNVNFPSLVGDLFRYINKKYFNNSAHNNITSLWEVPIFKGVDYDELVGDFHCT